MNIKRLCLIAGLLSLPVTYANAAEGITINVRVEVTNLPAASQQVAVNCSVGVGAPSSGAYGWSEANLRSSGRAYIPGDVRNYSGDVRIQIREVTRPGRYLVDATHYKCVLFAFSGARLTGQNELNGVIPR